MLCVFVNVIVQLKPRQDIPIALTCRQTTVILPLLMLCFQNQTLVDKYIYTYISFLQSAISSMHYSLFKNY